MDILNLPHLKVIRVNDTVSETDYYITAVSTAPIECCQSCGVIHRDNVHLSKFGTRKYVYMDIPIHARRVIIGVERQRYKCRDCGATFYEQLPDMDTKREMTTRLVKYIQKQSLNETFVTVANRIGIDESTVRSIFREHVAELEKKFKFVKPNRIGMDEIHMFGKARFVLTNLEHHTLLDMLHSNTLEVLRPYFFKRQGNRDVEFIATDMFTGYHTIAKEFMPDAKVVVDKYHVVQYANYAVRDLRVHIGKSLTATERRRLMRNKGLLLSRKELSEVKQEKLNAYLTAFPELYNAYVLKEFFYDIYDAPDRHNAELRFQQWKATITPDVAPFFKQLVEMVEKFNVSIFNYWDSDKSVTNAFTESLNNLTRIVNRNGRGYSFEAIRAKMLFTKGHKAPPKEPVKKSKFRERVFYNRSEPIRESKPRSKKTLGVSISTLEQLFADNDD